MGDLYRSDFSEKKAIELMITMYTARTSEIDEISEAIDEIKSQIDLSSLKKHSGGILYCHPDLSKAASSRRCVMSCPFASSA